MLRIVIKYKVFFDKHNYFCCCGSILLSKGFPHTPSMDIWIERLKRVSLVTCAACILEHIGS